MSKVKIKCLTLATGDVFINAKDLIIYLLKCKSLNEDGRLDIDELTYAIAELITNKEE
jgi:hypothetical protein